MRYRSRFQLIFAVLGGVCLLASLLAVVLFAFGPLTSTARAPVLLLVFVSTLIVTLLCGTLLLRWLLRPYRQLVGEAERAPVSTQPKAARDEAEFVLETFQSVVAQLQSQQRTLETMRAEATARADSAEKFNERIVASVPSGLIAFGPDGRATMVNAPARALLEADGKAEGKKVSALLLKAPELAEMVERCLKSGELYRREEVESTSAGGRIRRLGVTVAPIDPSTGRGTRGAICLLTDLTEVTQLREQLALKRNLESLGEMSAGLAHEFKNALATLHGYAQLIQTLELDERGGAAAAALLGEVRSLSSMVTSFLNFARPQPLELADVSLRELVDDCALELRGLFDEKRIKLELDGDFPNVRADERMLRQALLNLIRNAAEAVEDEAVERFVRVRASTERSDSIGDSAALIEISDSGPGISEQDLHRIFIPFFTTKSKGHGVGLALAHRVVTQHGGTLDASNLSDRGAVFLLRLPV
jgi:nitrogen fixation/metabolism regulation signal transduction histidine kinase